MWLAGFGTGGALCICAGARPDPTCRGVAALGAPADFDDWAGHPRRLLEHARELGPDHVAGVPAVARRVGREFRSIRPVTRPPPRRPRRCWSCTAPTTNRCPHFDARVLGDAHGSAELRIIAGAGHQLRHDPRAIAILLGWLDRERNRVTTIR